MSRKVRLDHVRTSASRSSPLGIDRSSRPCLAWRRCAFLWVLLLGALGVSAARADDVLDIPPECGSSSELSREIDALRASTTHLRSAGAHPEVQLTREGDAFVLHVSLPEGARTLRDPDCRALFRAAIVIAALGHESSAQAVLEEEQRPAQAVTPAPVAPSSSAQNLTAPPPKLDGKPARSPGGAPASALPRARPALAAPARVRGPRPPPRADAFVQAELAYGVVPSLSAAVEAGAHFQRGSWGGRLTLGYLTPRSHEQADRGVRVQALVASLSAEFNPVRWLYVGLGVDLFVLRGRGVGVRNPRADWAAQEAPHVSLRALVWQRGRFGLGLCARALWSPKPSVFGLRDGGTLYTAEHFAFQAGLSGSVQFL